MGYTKNDIKIWSNLVARFMTAAGVTHDDVVQIAFRYGLFTGAFGVHYGAETIGASVIPMGTGNTEKQIMIMQDYKTTVLVSTPSYAIALADRIAQLGVDPKSLSLKFGLFGGESWSEKMRNEIEKRLLLSATDNYGLSEVIGPVWPVNVRVKKVCIFMKTHSFLRLLILKQARYCRPEARVNWCLQHLPKKPFP